MTPSLELVDCGKGTRIPGAFSIGRTPTTNDQYARFVATAGVDPPGFWRSPSPPDHLSDHPVVEVSRADARGFCEWLSAEIRRHIRLPTKEEWIWAAVGSDDTVYPWGDTFVAGRCNSLESNIGTTTPVDAHQAGASPFGVLDMAGNVWEWCADDDEDGWATLKGGCWLDADWGVRPARSLAADPTRGSATVGFRVVAEQAAPRPPAHAARPGISQVLP